MNNIRRKKLDDAIRLLNQVNEMVSRIFDEENDAFESIPENLEASDRYEKIEAAVDELSEALENLEAARENLNNAKK